MKFDIEVPEWTRYLAQDNNGEWKAFDAEPMPECSWWRCGTPCKWLTICKGEPPEDWTQELYEVYWV